MALTKKQKEVYDYIIDYQNVYGHPPTQREIKDFFGLKSFGSVQKYLQYLKNNGLLEKTQIVDQSEIKVRGIEIASPKKSDKNVDPLGDWQVPLLGQVAAGAPLLNFNQVTESVVIPPHFFKKGEELFALKVKGDSMIEAGILNNDLAICHKAHQLKNGDISVFNYNQEITLKNFKKNKNGIELISANQNYQPIKINFDLLKDHEHFSIIGCLKGIIRDY